MVHSFRFDIGAFTADRFDEKRRSIRGLVHIISGTGVLMLKPICRITSQPKLSSQKRRVVAESAAPDELDCWFSWASRCTQQFSPFHWDPREHRLGGNMGLPRRLALFTYTCRPCRLSSSTERGLHGRQSSPRASSTVLCRGG